MKSTVNGPPVAFEDKYFPKTITGGYIDKYQPAGYCHYALHKGYLLGKHIENKQCVEKNCKYLERNESSQYFIDLYVKRIKKAHLKKLKSLFNAGVIPVSIYMMYQDRIKAISRLKDLESFENLQIQITVPFGTLLNLDMKGDVTSGSDEETSSIGE